MGSAIFFSCGYIRGLSESPKKLSLPFGLQTGQKKCRCQFNFTTVFIRNTSIFLIEISACVSDNIKPAPRGYFDWLIYRYTPGKALQSRLASVSYLFRRGREFEASLDCRDPKDHNKFKLLRTGL